jgi:hypothetical protein
VAIAAVASLPLTLEMISIRGDANVTAPAARAKSSSIGSIKGE